MEINLLPKHSPIGDYRFLIIVLPILLVLAGASFGFIRFWELDHDLTQTRVELVRTKIDNAVLKAERNVDSKTQLMNEIEASVKQVQQKAHNDGVMLDGIAAKLSDKTRVTSATMDADKQTITLEMQSDSVENIADYAVLLRSEPWVKDVFIQNIMDQTDDKEAAKLNKEIPFITKVVITLAPTEIPVQQPTGTTKN
ncbi:MAG: hypothetical protein ACXVDJ_11455 [Tumebacillaceae bacterium]